MQTIKKPHPWVLTLLRIAMQGEGPLRPFRYLHAVQVAEGRLVHHLVTGELVLLEDGEPLPDAGCFMVPETCDDHRAYLDVYEAARGVFYNKKTGAKPSTFIVFTTTECNARCAYCYENGARRFPMSLETADAVADAIIGSGNDSVKVTWFGGEPLANTQVIDRICAKLRTAGVEYRSTMVTNASLFRPETIETAKNDWHLDDVQITLDGTEDAYDAAKDYLNKKRDNYQSVLRNIELLLDAGVAVAVRMNVDLQNAQDLQDLCVELADRLGSSELFSAYPHNLFNDQGLMSAGDLEEIFAAQNAIEELLVRKGVAWTPETLGPLKLSHCMMDNKTTVAIDPAGEVYLCSHVPLAHVGNLTDYDLRNDAAERARERLYFDDCPECALLPKCVQLRHCPDRILCGEAYRLGKERLLERAMLAEYNRKRASS